MYDREFIQETKITALMTKILPNWFGSSRCRSVIWRGVSRAFEQDLTNEEKRRLVPVLRKWADIWEKETATYKVEVTMTVSNPSGSEHFGLVRAVNDATYDAVRQLGFNVDSASTVVTPNKLD